MPHHPSPTVSFLKPHNPAPQCRPPPHGPLSLKPLLPASPLLWHQHPDSGALAPTALPLPSPQPSFPPPRPLIAEAPLPVRPAPNPQPHPCGATNLFPRTAAICVSPDALTQLLSQGLVLDVIAEELCIGNQTDPLQHAEDSRGSSRGASNASRGVGVSAAAGVQQHKYKDTS